MNKLGKNLDRDNIIADLVFATLDKLQRTATCRTRYKVMYLFESNSPQLQKTNIKYEINGNVYYDISQKNVIAEKNMTTIVNIHREIYDRLRVNL